MSVIDPTEYVIRTRFDVQSQIPGLTNVSNQITRIEAAVGGLGRNITGNLMGALGVLGSTIGLGLAVKGMVGLNSELEQAQVGIAALLHAFEHTSMNNALRTSSALVRQLRIDAAEGAGSLSNYLEGFQTIIGPVIGAGGTRDTVRELNRLMINVGALRPGGGGMQLAAMDVYQALTAGAGSRTTAQVLNPALAAIGLTPESFNKLGLKERLDTLMKAFGSYGEAIKVMGKTWSAQMDTFKDRIKQVAMVATQPLFAAWRDDLRSANEWLVRNQDALNSMAETVSKKLVGAWQALKANGLGLASGGTGATAGLVGMRVAMGLGMTGPGGMLAGGIVAFLTAAVTQAIGRFPELGALVRSALGDMLGAFSELFGAVKHLMQSPLVSGFATWVGKKVVELGVGMVALVTLIVRFTDMLVTTIDTNVRALTAGLQAMRALSHGNAAEARAFGLQVIGTYGAGLARFDEQLKGFFEFTDAKGDPYRRLGDPSVDGQPVTPAPVNNFNGPVTVKVQAERLDDPNMVATTFEAIMRRLAEYPTTVRGGSGRLVPKPL